MRMSHRNKRPSLAAERAARIDDLLNKFQWLMQERSAVDRALSDAQREVDRWRSMAESNLGALRIERAGRVALEIKYGLRPPPHKTCPVCQKEFPTKGSKFFCSSACVRHSQNDLRRLNRWAKAHGLPAHRALSTLSRKPNADR